MKDPGQANIWLCKDWSADGVDNDGDSTIDNEAATCTGPGEGSLEIIEQGRNIIDLDSPNDDDDDDGYPVDQAYCDANPLHCPPEVSALIDHDGGELPEGFGAFEFQVKYDHKTFDISIESLIGGVCTMTILTENDIRFGCVSFAPGFVGQNGPGPFAIAKITVSPDPDLFIRLKPGKDNGVVKTLLDENCEFADVLGDPMAGTAPGGLLKNEFCGDATLTVRYLEGDLNADCEVGLLDTQAEAFRYGAFFGSLWYGPFYDLEPPLGDFDIDIKDLQFVAGRFGSTCQNPVPDQPPTGPPPGP